MAKIKFGLKNVHYSEITDNGTTITYGTPKRLPGAVSISVSPEGEIVEFAADDNAAYYSAEINGGYSGSLSIADLPETFATDILGDEVVNGIQYESSEQKGKQFALMFEISTDEKARKYVLYNCTATRPTIASNTKGATVDPQTSELTFNARPHAYNYLIKANTTQTASEVVFNGWYDAVHEKSSVVGGD